MDNPNDKMTHARSTEHPPVQDVAPAAQSESSKLRAPSVPTDTARNYEVGAGDSLQAIARHFYGDADGWQRIFAANRDQLSGPDAIKPGQMLKIPHYP